MTQVSLLPELTMLRVGNFQFYLWEDGVSRTLIDTGAVGSRDHVAAIIRGELPAPQPVFEDWKLPIHAQVSAGLPWVVPAVPVDRELVGGEVLPFGGGAEVIAIPGHTAGSIAIYLPEHRTLFTGDTIANVGQLTLGVFNQDRALTVASFRRLAELEVDIACFGHGEPILFGAGQRLREVASTL